MKVKVYKTNGCPWCEKAIKYLKNNEVEIEILNCSENEEYKKELIAKTHQNSVPVIEINNEIIIGFDKKKIDELINIEG